MNTRTPTERRSVKPTIQEVTQARAFVWQLANDAAIEAHNARVEKDGVLLTPDWAAQD